MPRGGTPKDENSAVPLLGQGGADSSRQLLSGWFEAVDGFERPSCLIPNHPCWAFRPSIPSSAEDGSPFQESSRTAGAV
jgi:hypothetical protein